MAFHLNPEQPIGEELKRVLREEMESAAQQLRTAADGNRDEAVHEARKSVKKIRATLRLVQTDLGELCLQKNAEFGEIGRTLSEWRDAGAMLETYDELRKQYGEQVDGVVWTALRRFLMKRKEDTEKAANEGTVFQDYPRRLEATAKQVDGWPLRGKGFSVIAPGLTRAFRRGRQAMKGAERTSCPENFHAWRKRVKDHWYHVRLLEAIWGDMMEAYGGVLKDIQMLLGDDHNLTVLREAMQAEENLRPLLPTIEKRQTQLREQALTAGVRVYGAKPKRVVGSFESWWNAPPEKTETFREA